MIRKMVWAFTAVLVANVVFAANISLPDARAKIGVCIEKPTEMASVIKQLAPADQLAFLAEVNETIAKMPGSNESKAAAFLKANRAAVKAATVGGKSLMLAEVFATVPPEVLTLINEHFATELLSRDIGSSKNVTDEQFMKVALNIMEKVNERCLSVENGAARATFAILMLVRADNGKIPELTETLIKTLPETAQNAARTEWIPAALGQSQEKTYLPLLGGADTVGEMAANAVVIRLVGPQLLESMLGDIVEGTPLINNSNRPDILYTLPVRETEDKSQAPVDQAHWPDPPIEPDGYQLQIINDCGC